MEEIGEIIPGRWSPQPIESIPTKVMPFRYFMLGTCTPAFGWRDHSHIAYTHSRCSKMVHLRAASTAKPCSQDEYREVHQLKQYRNQQGTGIISRTESVGFPSAQVCLPGVAVKSTRDSIGHRTALLLLVTVPLVLRDSRTVGGEVWSARLYLVW